MTEDPSSRALMIVRATDAAPSYRSALEAVGVEVVVVSPRAEMLPPPPGTALVIVDDATDDQEPAAAEALEAWVADVRASGLPVVFTAESAAARTSRRVEELERGLTEARRHEIVGRLVGGVAHDFNNVLSVVSTLTELLLRFGDADNPAREDLEEILGAARRGSELTRQLQAFSRAEAGRCVAVDLGERLQGAEKLVRKLLPADIEATLERGASVPEVWIDPAEADQIVFNLTAHGRWALPRGGGLRLATEPGPSGAALVTLEVTPRVGVAGAGVPADTGSGDDDLAGAAPIAGLTAVEEVVRRRDGALRVERRNAGTVRVEVELPPAGPDRSATSGDGAHVEGHGRSVLVVEDDASVRDALERTVASMGFAVRGAATLDEALETLRRDGADVVLCDAVLPGGWGLELHRSARSAGIDARFVFMSAYDHHPAVEAIRREAIEVVRKPVARGALEKAFAEALAGGAGDG